MVVDSALPAGAAQHLNQYVRFQPGVCSLHAGQRGSASSDSSLPLEESMLVSPRASLRSGALSKIQSGFGRKETAGR